MIVFLKFITIIWTVAMNIVKSLLLVVLFSSLRPRISRYKNSKNSECVILGNGPSLKESILPSLSFFQNKTIICVNDFAESPYFHETKPSYYILTDPAYWSPHASDRFKSIFARYNEILVKIQWDMIICMPHAAKKWNYFMNIPSRNPHVKLCYINTVEVPCFRKMQYWLYRKNLAMVPMQNVLVAAIFVALNLDFRKIFVLGADHSWHESLVIDEKNDLYLVNNRFQDTKEATRSPFTVDSTELKKYNMYQLFRDLSRMYLGYMELEAYSKTLNAKIYNATKKSYIDAFERFDISKHV